METGFSAGADQELLRKAWGFLGAQERGVLEGMYAGKPSALSALESICEENRDEQRKKTGKAYVRGISDRFGMGKKVRLMVSVRKSGYM